jgi:signal transduction histidine kinase
MAGPEDHGDGSHDLGVVLEALEFAGIGLYRYTFDGIVLRMDRGALRILDLEGLYPDPRVVVGKRIEDLIVYLGPQGRLRQNVREQGHVRDFEYHFRTLTGKERWALHDSFLVCDPDRNGEAIQAIVRDITERKRAEELLRTMREEAEIYLDLMSHDMTNYNQTLLGYLNLLESYTHLDENQRRYLRSCKRQVLRSERLISNFRGFSRAKEIRGEDLGPVDLGAIIESSIAMVMDLHPDRSPRVSTRCGQGSMARGTRLLETVFFNVIENAVWHSPDHHPCVSLTVSDEGEGGGERWLIRVEDQGPGIPDALKVTVFDRQTRDAAKGMGLGLPLAKAILEAMGGSIVVKDRVVGNFTGGSVFEIRVLKR